MPIPGMVWPRKSALGSHPCVALSSAPVQISLTQKEEYRTRKCYSNRKYLPGNRLARYNYFVLT